MGCEDGIAAESVPDPGDSGRGATSQVGEDLVGGAHHMEQEGEAQLGGEADVGLEGEALQRHGGSAEGVEAGFADGHYAGRGRSAAQLL